MPDAITKVFEAVGARGHEPQLEKTTAAIRFDFIDGKRTEHWLVTVDKGDIEVARKRAPADLVIGCERALAERLFTGRANAMSAVLRGELTVEGSAELLVVVQRLLPRPRVARRRGVAAGYARQR